MKPQRLLDTAIIPALNELDMRGIADSPDARRFLLAIALQESNLQHRRQVSASGVENGPASSFWQFERMGACVGVLRHASTKNHMAFVCEEFNVEPTPMGLWQAMQYNDIVAAMAARLLIYTLPSKLPTTAEQGWAQYLSGWRPGRPHLKTWAAHWATATTTVKGE